MKLISSKEEEKKKKKKKKKKKASVARSASRKDVRPFVMLCL